jgi:hypothetical protein
LAAVVRVALPVTPGDSRTAEELVSVLVTCSDLLAPC